MAFSAAHRDILRDMHRHSARCRPRARGAFTLTEVLVALIVVGAAVAGLAGTLTADRRLRNLAAANAFAGARARERLELLADLPCSADTAGTIASTWGSERWRASPAGSVWSLTDSLQLMRLAAPLVFEARVACPE